MAEQGWDDVTYIRKQKAKSGQLKSQAVGVCFFAFFLDLDLFAIYLHDLSFRHPLCESGHSYRLHPLCESGHSYRFTGYQGTMTM